MTTASRPVLEVVTASTRPGRVGRAFADWFVGVDTGHGAFEVVDVDLAKAALPFLDEPHHPKLGRAACPGGDGVSGRRYLAELAVLRLDHVDYLVRLAANADSCIASGTRRITGTSIASGYVGNVMVAAISADGATPFCTRACSTAGRSVSAN
jgi:hypothetical protein